MKPVKLRPHVQFEIDEIVDWYNLQRENLGDEFTLELDAILKNISEFPGQYASALAKRRVRRAFVNRFPYAVYYIEKSIHVEIISVVHCERSPDHWKRFLP